MTRLGRSFDSQWTQKARQPSRSRHSEPTKAPENGQMKEAAPGDGRQVGSKRTSRSRLWANTAECTYAWKCSQPRQRQRSSPKQRFK